MNLIDCKGDLRIACYKSRRKTTSYFGAEKQRESGVGNTGVEPVLVCVCAQSWEGTGESPITVIFTGNPVPAARKINSALLSQPGSAPGQGSARAAPSLHTGRVFSPACASPGPGYSPLNPVSCMFSMLSYALPCLHLSMSAQDMHYSKKVSIILSQKIRANSLKLKIYCAIMHIILTKTERYYYHHHYHFSFIFNCILNNNCV